MSRSAASCTRVVLTLLLVVLPALLSATTSDHGSHLVDCADEARVLLTVVNSGIGGVFEATLDAERS